jgi:hypothetical protein
MSRNYNIYTRSNFNILGGRVYGLHGKVRLWSYASETSLRINMAECRKCSTTFNASVLYHISTKCMKWLMEMPICKVNFFMNQYGGKLELRDKM